MEIWEAVILGILQGIAEFLPISSSGHLVLLQKILGIDGEANITFDIILHLGTLIPVFIVYWNDIWAIIKKPFQKMTFMIILGTIPTVIFALLFKDGIEGFFESGKYLGYAFIFTGVVLLYADRTGKGRRSEKDMNIVDAAAVGCMQAVAIIPAISRSGSTISGALFRKLDRETAAKYSFLLSIPAILGAAVLEIKKFIDGEAVIDNVLSAPYIFGFLASAVFGYIAIKFMLRLINNCKLRYFSIYVFILGALIIFDQFVSHLLF